MLSILERMNPAVCLGLGGGGLSAVYDIKDDDVLCATNASDSHSTHDRRIPKRSSSSFNCISSPHCHSKYQPDDKEEPLPSDVVLQSLSRTVPDLLERISTPNPKEYGNASPCEMRKSVRELNARRYMALQKLYDLTEKGNEHNRVPLVCNDEDWDVVGVLSKALLASTEEVLGSNSIETGRQAKKGKMSVDEDRRLMCWTLNNLSIPYENKEAIAMGKQSVNLFHALTTVIQLNLPETYLCCICLLNLTYLADALIPITFYVHNNGKPPYSPIRSSSTTSRETGGRPPTSPFSRSRSLSLQQNHRPLHSGKNLWSESGRISEMSGLVLGNSSSLIRVIERMMLINAPFLLSTVQSVQGEAIRWSCGLVRNVTYARDANNDDGDQGSDSLSGTSGRRGIVSRESIEEICILVSQTEIPRLMVQILKDSQRPIVKWTKDSLEDICLGAMCNMAQWQSSQESLKRAEALQCLEKIEGLPGIHGYRARAIRCSLGALPLHLG